MGGVGCWVGGMPATTRDCSDKTSAFGFFGFCLLVRPYQYIDIDSPAFRLIDDDIMLEFSSAICKSRYKYKCI